MANTRSIEEKIQASIDPEAMEIETNAAAESKEEEKSVALVELKKYTLPFLDKQLTASFVAAFNEFCSPPSFRGPINISLFLFLGRIPAHILLERLLPFLALEANSKDYYSLVRVERPLGSLFRIHLPDLHLTQLLQHIAYGEKAQAEKIIQQRPHLLLLNGPIVQDYAGRKIQQTAYQMAIAAGDVFVGFKKGKYLPRVKGEEMKEIIERYVIKMLGEEKGVAELERQRKMILPDDFEIYIKQKRAEDLAALTKVYNAIRYAESLDGDGLLEECGKALKEFKTHLEPKGIITTTTQGYHFDPQILTEAYRLYEANYEDFGDEDPSQEHFWDCEKNQFAWQKIIGLIQRYLTACDAMVLCQGTYPLVKKGEKFERTLNFRHDDAIYFPLDTDPEVVFGENMAASSSGGTVLAAGCGGSYGNGRCECGNCNVKEFGSLMSSKKTSSLRKPMHHPDSLSKTRRVIR